MWLSWSYTWFSYMYHILNPYKTSWNEMILKSAIEFSCKLKIIIHHSISKVYDYMFGVYLFNFIIMYIFVFKLITTIHNFFTTLMILPYICDIWIEYTLCKVQCNAKNVPPYLAPTKWHFRDIWRSCKYFTSPHIQVANLKMEIILLWFLPFILDGI